jgi:hypothetical protein
MTEVASQPTRCALLVTSSMFPVILAAAALKGMTGWDEEHIHPTNKAMGQLMVNGVAGRTLDGVRMPGT